MKKLVALAVVFVLAGCGESMDQQNRLKTYGESKGLPGWHADGEALLLPQGVVSQNDLVREHALTTPPPVNAALLARGRQRYEIYCSPCHGLTGAGDGMIVARGFPKPLPFDDAQLMQADAHHLVDVISNGSGRMYSFSNRVEPTDRWAIVAYIRALQLAATRKTAP